MPAPRNFQAAPRMPRRQALVTLLAAAGVVVLPACGGGGGGGGVAGVDTGGTGSFSAGRISGFGSVIVNGVRFEDNAARIADDDDEARVLTRDDLRLGMVVRVEAGAVATNTGDLPTATATAIVVESQIKGLVESKTGTDTLVVFGQSVRVTASTVFEPGVTFADIAVGQVLEVHGFADAAGVVTASRIEREAGANEFKVRGVIANLTATTFQVGAATFNFASASRLPSVPLANGQFVRVRTTTTRNASGQWVVTRIDLRTALENRAEAEAEGVLQQSGTAFSINGIPIDFSQLPSGASFVGQRVEVEGALVGGVLVAREIKVENEAEEAKVDVRGTASSVNTTAQTFVVRGVTFHYTAGSTREIDGTIAANLRDGADVRVKGTLPLGGTGNVEATEIDFRP